MTAVEEQARSIFLAALDRAPGDWPAFLEEACAGNADLRANVEQLLCAHQAMGSIHGTGQRSPVTIDQPAGVERAGTVIGPYKLMEQIGEGGMGLVFVAEQHQPVRRRVALKVIKPGMDTRDVIARFEAERQALALMDHPNIARVQDAGSTASGRPYFVMELVKGVPITQYCDDNRLPPRERLELFAQVCHAVQHAHQKGIIHRDIKPSNVLVASHDGKPVVKVIDFGVAKAIGQQLTERTIYTAMTQMVGTPLYMSPEQAGMSGLDIDTRTDIYSLGVLLYELLTGTTPFDKERLKQAAFEEMRRIIREEEPQKPSTRISATDAAPGIAAQRNTDPAKLMKLVRGDLDWIVMKALEKDRGRRYETANGFALDVQRYLADEPVLACPPSAAYRFRKFARRNKAALLTASLLITALLVLVAGLALSNVRVIAERNEKSQALKDREAALRAARESAKQAEAESKRTKKNFLAARIAIREVITKAALGDAEWSQLPPPLRKKFSEEAARFYQGLIQESTDPGDRFETAIAYRSLGLLHARRGSGIEDRDQAEDCYRKSITILDELSKEYPAEGEYRKDLALCCRMLGGFLWHQRDHSPQADELLRRATGLFSQLASEEPDFLDYSNELSKCLIEWQTISGSAAIEEYEHLLDGPGRLFAQRARAQLLAQTGRLREAEQLCREVAAEFDRLAAESPVMPQHRYAQAVTELQLAQILSQADRAADAESAYRKSIALFERALLNQGQFAEADAAFAEHLRLHSDHAAALRGLGSSLRKQKKFADAIPPLREAIRLDPTDFWAHESLGWALLEVQRSAEAEAAFREAIRIQPAFAWSHFGLGRLLREQKRFSEALVPLREGVRLDPNHHPGREMLAWTLFELKQFAEAEPEFRESIRLKPDSAGGHNGLGRTLQEQKRFAASIAPLREAIRLHPGNHSLHAALGRTLVEQKEHTQAEPEFRESIRLKPDSAGGHLGLGRALLEQEKFSDAEAELREALRLEPTNRWALGLLNRALVGQGKLAEAESNLKTNHDHKPQQPETKETRD